MAHTDRLANSYAWVNLVWDAKLLAGVQHNGSNGRIVGMANAREQMMHNLQDMHTQIIT